MNTTTTLTRDFNGHAFVFREDGWFNMTKAAKHFGKRIQDFWDNKDTKEYILALCKTIHANQRELFSAKAGYNGGTWAHPKLAVFFARWLDVRFAVWCDAVIDDILKGKAEVVITKPAESAVAALPEEFTVTAKALASQVANLQTELSSVYALVLEQNVALKELKAATRKPIGKPTSVQPALLQSVPRDALLEVDEFFERHGLTAAPAYRSQFAYRVSSYVREKGIAFCPATPRSAPMYPKEALLHVARINRLV